MHYVYILRSEIDKSRYYYGSTSNMKVRLESHNNGRTKHTAKHKPWKIIWYGAFENKKVAANFEKYLKTASGKAFYRKRFQ